MKCGYINYRKGFSLLLLVLLLAFIALSSLIVQSGSTARLLGVRKDFSRISRFEIWEIWLLESKLKIWAGEFHSACLVNNIISEHHDDKNRPDD
jgi:hypothetical protein